VTPERPTASAKAARGANSRPDFSGGLASGALAVGSNVAVGVIAFAPLGDAYLALGVFAAMLSSFMGGLGTYGFGGAPGFIVGPKMTTAILFAGLLTKLGLPEVEGGLGIQEPELVLALGLCAVLLSGGFQFLLAVFGFGELGKFIPYPVVAGIRTATALLLIRGQIWHALGTQPRREIAEIRSFVNDPEIQVVTLLVAGSAAALMVWGNKLLPRARWLVPVTALVLGTLFYQAMTGLGMNPLADCSSSPDEYCQTLRTLSLSWSPPAFESAWVALNRPVVWAIVSAAGAMALLDALALLSLSAFQDIAGARFDGRGQLRGQGIGTMASALVGGLSTSGILARAIMNHSAGGRTRMSGVFHAISVLVVALLVAGLLGLVPKAAVAGLVLVLAFRLFDPWSLTQIREIRRADAHLKADNVVNLLQMLFVVIVGIVMNMVWAVGAGVVVSVFTFAVGMARDPFRGDPRLGKAARSWRRRFDRFERILDEYGRGVALIRLKGAIFFGTCDKIVEKIEEVAAELPDDVERLFVVLDLDRVPNVDATGYKVLGQTYARLKRRRPPIDLAFSFVTPGRRRKAVAEELVAVGIPAENMFFTSDHALETFEEEIIRTRDAYRARQVGWTVRDFGNTWGLTERESEDLGHFVVRRAFKPRELLFEEGGTDRSLFLIADGVVDVSIAIPGEQRRRRRVATFSEGTVVGEMGLLDGTPRSASVTARSDVAGFELTLDAFQRLVVDRSGIAAKIVAEMGRVARHRLRQANEVIKELES
jgi:SulP family sulfate permease